MSRILALLTGTVVIAGSGVVPGVAAPPPADRAFLIARDAAGPIRLGMTREVASKIEGFPATPATLRLRTGPTSVLRFERAGEVVAVAELAQGKVSRLRLLSARFLTPEGVHTGMDARSLGKRYGAGKVFARDGIVSAVFPKAPGHSFYFRTTPDLLVKPDWKKVVAQNPTIEVIVIAGS